MIQHEKKFSNLLVQVAKLYGCEYIVIPDCKYQTGIKRKGIVDVKKPYDGNFVTPNGVLLVELKYKYGTFKKHQKENLAKANEKSIKKVGYCLRKFENYYTFATVEYDKNREIKEGKRTKCKDLPELIDKLKNLLK